MELIPYEHFTINPSSLERLTEHYVRDEIKKYFKENGTLPSKEIVDTFTLPADKLERYKKHYYAEYYRKELEFEEKYGPGETIETTFEFSTIEDSGTTILGTTRSGVSSGNEEYQYEYWTIVTVDNGFHTVRTFTTLNGVTIRLNTTKTYDIYVYHRKSNHQYHKIQGWCDLDGDGYGEYANGFWLSTYDGYDTQMEDKEYIGVVRSYKPQKNGVIRGSVYTLNPRVQLTVSGLTSGISMDIELAGFSEKLVTFECGQYGEFSTSGDASKLTKIDDSSFTYLLTKDELIRNLVLPLPFQSSIDFESPLSVLIEKNSDRLHFYFSNIKKTYDICDIYRNALNSATICTLDEEETDIGIEIDTIDD